MAGEVEPLDQKVKAQLRVHDRRSQVIVDSSGVMIVAVEGLQAKIAQCSRIQNVRITGEVHRLIAQIPNDRVLHGSFAVLIADRLLDDRVMFLNAPSRHGPDELALIIDGRLVVDRPRVASQRITVRWITSV